MDNRGTVSAENGTTFTVRRTLDNTGTMTFNGVFPVGADPTPTSLEVRRKTTNSGTITASGMASTKFADLDNNANGRVEALNLGNAARKTTIEINGTVNNAQNGKFLVGRNSVIKHVTGSFVNNGQVTATGAFNAEFGLFSVNRMTNNGEIRAGTFGAYSGDVLTNHGTVTVVDGQMTLNKNQWSSITNHGTITTRKSISGAFIATNTITNLGTVNECPGTEITFKKRLIKAEWNKRGPNCPENRRGASDPEPSFSIGLDTQIGPTGVITGEGFEVVGGDFRNFSKQNSLFDMTAIELIFIDPEVLTPLEFVEEASDIYRPSPVYLERDVSHLYWPRTVDMTDPDRLGLGLATLYLEHLVLIPGPEDDGSSSGSVVLEDGGIVPVFKQTTLDLRGGGVIYLANMLPEPLQTFVKIWDSLDPTRPLEDMIRPLDLAMFPENNFAIQSLVLDGADYVALLVPEPGSLVFIALGIGSTLGRRRRRWA
jgi:hypothetical protein